MTEKNEEKVPVQQEKVSDVSYTVEDVNKKFKTGGRINLVNDAGLAKKKILIQQKAMVVCSIILILSLIVGISGYGFNYYFLRQLEMIENEVSDSEAQLEALKPTFIVLQAYKNRLKFVQDLEDVNTNLKLKMVEDMEEVAVFSESDIHQYSYDLKDGITGKFIPTSVISLYKLMEFANYRESSTKWKGLIVENVTSEINDAGQNVISASLSTQPGEIYAE